MVGKATGLLIALGTAFVLCFSSIGCYGSDGDGGGGEDEGGPGGCGFESCGGDPVGSWSIESICIEDPERLMSTSGLPAACSSMIRDIDYRPLGEIVFQPDGTGSANITFVADMSLSITAACIAAMASSEVTLSPGVCAAMEDSFSSTSEFQGGSCQLAGSSCMCLVTTVENTASSGGGYRVEGERIVEDSGEISLFCVSGSTLTIRGDYHGIGIVMTFEI